MDNQITNFLELKDNIIKDGYIGLLCNQTAYDFNLEKYLFEILAERKALKRVFIPEHGLFSELQDQIPLNSTEIYKELVSNVEFISLYQNNENSLKISANLLRDLNVLLIDIQDTGCRYFTYISTIYYIFETITANKLNTKVYIIDRPNPAGRRVEGTLLSKEYSSFIGVGGLPHRQGLTIGEMCLFLKAKTGGTFPIKVLPLENINSSFAIQPSPNIPTRMTSLIYSGQCLFEGTILSEGRGTTNPFSIIGAPFLKWNDLLAIKKKVKEYTENYNYLNSGIKLRPLCFIPAFHKFADELCRGFHLHLTGNEFHSLLYSLILLRTISDYLPKINIWRQGQYEFGSNKTAIEILAGDKVLIDYLEGKESINQVKAVLREGENDWIRKTDKYRIYDEKLHRLDF